MTKLRNPLVLSLIAAFVVSLAIATSLQMAQAQLTAASPNYREHGSLTGAVNASITKSLYMKVGKEISFIITATGGNFNNTTLAVAVSEDGTNFFTVDSISLGTATIKGDSYSDTNHSSTVPLNVVNFPYIKFTTNAGVTGVTEKLTWTIR